jgi:hypothetical protein
MRSQTHVQQDKMAQTRCKPSGSEKGRAYHDQPYGDDAIGLMAAPRHHSFWKRQLLEGLSEATPHDKQS